MMKKAIVVLALLFLVGCNGVKYKPHKCLDPDPVRGRLVKVADPIPDRYIIKFRTPVDATDQEIGGILIGMKAVRPMTEALAVEMPAAKVQQLLKAFPEIEYIEPEQTYSIKECTYGKDQINQRNLKQLDGDCVNGATGAGVDVYVLDTGIDPNHPDFSGRLAGGFSSQPGSPADVHGHGTHVAGTIAGTRWGLATGAQIYSVRVMDSGGSGSTSDVVAGIDWITAKAIETGRPAVANASLGGGDSPTLNAAVCRSIAAGVVWAVSGGNSALPACRFSPARVDLAYTVGAIDRNVRRAQFSNHGTCLDVFAAGVDVESARMGGGSIMFSGTSMSSPHVAGVAALCIESQQDLNECIINNATPDLVEYPGTDSPNKVIFFNRHWGE